MLISYSSYIKFYTHYRFVYVAGKYDTVYFKEFEILVYNKEYLQSMKNILLPEYPIIKE